MTVQSPVQRPVQRQRMPQQPPAPKSKQGARWPFWLGFGLSFLVLTVISLALLLMSMGLDNFDLASLQNSEAAWSPPPIVLTPDVGEEVVSAAGAGGDAAALGRTLRNVANTGVFIRYTPGYIGKSESDKLGRIAPGGIVEIIGGPATADDIVWWQIRYQNSDGSVIEGWSAQTAGSGLQILAPVQ